MSIDLSNSKPSDVVKVRGFKSIKHLSELSGVGYEALRKWPRKKPEAFMALIEENQKKLEG